MRWVALSRTRWLCWRKCSWAPTDVPGVVLHLLAGPDGLDHRSGRRRGRQHQPAKGELHCCESLEPVGICSMACLFAPLMLLRYDDCGSMHALGQRNPTVTGSNQWALSTSRDAGKVLTSEIARQRGTDDHADSAILACGIDATIERWFVCDRSALLRQAGRQATGGAGINSQLRALAATPHDFGLADVRTNGLANEVCPRLLDILIQPLAGEGFQCAELEIAMSPASVPC